MLGLVFSFCPLPTIKPVNDIYASLRIEALASIMALLLICVRFCQKLKQPVPINLESQFRATLLSPDKYHVIVQARSQVLKFGENTVRDYWPVIVARCLLINCNSLKNCSSFSFKKLAILHVSDHSIE